MIPRRSLATILALFASIAPAAPVEHVLSPVQAQMLDRAHREFGQSYRLFSKRIGGELKTVVIFAEDGRRTVAEHEFTKEMLDQFEHFAIHRPFRGAYDNGGKPFKRPHSELAPHAKSAKSVHDLGRFHRPSVFERLEAATVATLDAIVEVGGRSRWIRDDDVSPETEAVLAAVLAAGLAGRLALHLTRFYLPRRANGLRAVARFADHWVTRKPAHKVLVAFVLAPYLPHLENLLTQDYFFEAGHL